MPDPLNLLWRIADLPNPTVTHDEIRSTGPWPMDRWMEIGWLRPCTPASYVTCDACGESHVEEVVSHSYPDGTTRFSIVCPDNGRVEVDPERLLQWRISYEPLAVALAGTLGIRSCPIEIQPQRVWNLGRATLNETSRPLWLARGLTWPDGPTVAASIPKGQSPVVFFLGQRPTEGLLSLPDDAIIEAWTVVASTDPVLIDRAAIESQLSTIAPTPKAAPAGKYSQRDALIGVIKETLREELRSRKNALQYADDHDRECPLPPLSQNWLARLTGSSASAISRAIHSDRDRELKILIDTLTDPDALREFQITTARR